MSKPLITVGIPTYNRLGSLRRAVASALAQDCGNVEILISDNASTDGTEEYCHELAAREPSVRYVRHPANRGPTANFNFVLRQATGLYFLFLCDDDWLDSSYASRCVGWLRAHPDYATAGGHARYVNPEGATATGRPIELEELSPARRVRTYLREVADNATFYSVLPRNTVERLSDLRNVVGADWLFVAEIASLGKVRALPDVHLHRALGDNISSSHRNIVENLGLPSIRGALHFGTLTWAFATDVLWRSPVHREVLTRRQRLVISMFCVTSMAHRQAWLVVLSLGRWPLTRKPYRMLKQAYLTLNHRTGGRLALRFPGYSTLARRAPDSERDQ